MKQILILISVVLFSSCVGLTSISTPQTVALNQGNFKFVKTVSASTSALYVLGIGGLSKEAEADVVEKLLEVAQLKQNQALADYRIKTTNKCLLGIVVTRTLTASATVVEFDNLGVDSCLSAGVESVVSLELSVRDAKLKRLMEISASLSNGNAGDIEAIKAEIVAIGQWYDENGYYKTVEWNEYKKVLELIQK